MNKLVKTVGFATTLTAAMCVNSLMTQNSDNSDKTVKEEYVQNYSDKKNCFNDPALWAVLTGMGVAGLSFINIRKKKFQAENLKADISYLTTNSCNITRQSNTTPLEKSMALDDNLHQLCRIINKEKIKNKAAYAQFEFTYGALKHAAMYGDIPEKDLQIKLEYLVYKSIKSPKDFEKTDKQYRQNYPNINFDETYGVIKYTKRAQYENFPLHEETNLYIRLNNNQIINRMNAIENDINKKENAFLFYPHDREELINTIDKIHELISRNQTPPKELLNKIMDIYRTKSLKKTIEI